MYALGMYFKCEGFFVELQEPSKKYRIFINEDERRHKDLSVIYVMNNYLKNIEIIYKNMESRDLKDHKFLNDELRTFLKKN